MNWMLQHYQDYLDPLGIASKRKRSASPESYGYGPHLEQVGDISDLLLVRVYPIRTFAHQRP